MADYWLTFRIENNPTYDTRYSGLIDALNENGTGFWEAPTSFVCIRSDLGIQILGRRLTAKLNAKTDLLVMREIGKDNTVYFGETGDGFLSFFPNAKAIA